MKIKYKVKRLPLEKYVNGYYEPNMTSEACKNCNSFMTSWSCPPLGKEYDNLFSRYSQAIIIGVTIAAETPEEASGYSELDLLSRPIRQKLSKRLLKWEELYGGLSMSTIGKCLYCGNMPCTRPSGKPCRHPELVRPSLEALGFNLVSTSENLLNIKLLWNDSEDKRLPVLTYLFGFFY
ncbi:MAG: DUF2284 domain-containing protein [Muribaculaceae bacterium]|nr:DUF2284 domain-containing protein [Muribaculaceae bacterium]